MSKTLIVSDNEFLNQLYVTNLEVYLATQVTLELSSQKAIELITGGASFDLIISMNMINGRDSAVALSQFIKNNNLKIPLIVIGNPINEIPNVVVVQSSYQLKNLLRASAEILRVTSKSMASLSVPDFFSVDIKFLMLLKSAPCQIFMQLKKSSEENNYALLAKKDANVTLILKKFSNEGIERLYVNKLDRLLVVNQVSTILCELIKNTENATIEGKSSALEAGFEFAASDFCNSPEAVQEILNIATACTKVMEEINHDTPGLRALLNLLASNKSGFLYTHSILASFVASHIVKNVSWGGESQIEKINFVLFFHDIVMAPIYLKYPDLKYEEDLLFSDLLNEKEKEMVLNHARLSAEIIMTYRRAPMGVDLLIKQHHGMTSGVGFAVEFKDDISPLSKIVLVAESFVEEYMKGKDADPDYQVNLKAILPILNNKFKKSTYRKITATLETIKL